PCTLAGVRMLADDPTGCNDNRTGIARSENVRTKGANSVGRVSIEFEIANNDDLALARRGLLREDQVRRQTISGVVDPGASKLVLPQAVVKQLGLPLGDKTFVRYADGRTALRREVEGVYVEI